MRTVYSFLCTLLLTPQLALAVPTSDNFKRLREEKERTIVNCSITGASNVLVPITMTLDRRRPAVQLPEQFKKAGEVVGPVGYVFAACGESGIKPGKFNLFLKKSRDSNEAIEINLSLSDFEKASDVSNACSVVRSWPSTMIYKKVGSGHFSNADPRRYSISLILRRGSGVPRPSCWDVVARNGKEVGQVGIYATGGEYDARYYGGWGCGTNISGSTLASRATDAAGSPEVFFKAGNICYGPIDARSCRNSSDTQC
jgi:hypothetical protein